MWKKGSWKLPLMIEMFTPYLMKRVVKKTFWNTRIKIKKWLQFFIFWPPLCNRHQHTELYALRRDFGPNHVHSYSHKVSLWNHFWAGFICHWNSFLTIISLKWPVSTWFSPWWVTWNDLSCTLLWIFPKTWKTCFQNFYLSIYFIVPMCDRK